MILFRKLSFFILPLILIVNIMANERPKNIQSTLHAGCTIKIGILSFKHKPETLAQWKPLESLLNQAIPECKFTVYALTYPELDHAVKNNQLDFVLTNPSHYIILKKSKILSSPLATLFVNESGKMTSLFGGVIFTLSSNHSIKTLKDLPHKKIAITDDDSMGGYQMQLYEINQKGISLPKDKDLIRTGMPHDKVIEAVLSQQADVGFVRSGVLEKMIRDGKIEKNSIKIINSKIYSELPIMLSTRLYPEWPLAALTSVDHKIAKRVVSVLYNIQENSDIANKMKISGFVTPVDYAIVDEMLRELHLPPYTTIKNITLSDIWHLYRWQILITLSVITMFVLLMIQLFRTKQQLERQFINEHKLNHALQRAEKIAKIGNWSLNLKTNTLHWSDEIFRIFEIDQTEFEPSYEQFLNAIHPDDREAVNTAYTNSLITKEKYHITHRLLMKDGRIKYVIEQCESDFDEEGNPVRSMGTIQDITQQQQVILKNDYLLQIVDNYVMYVRVDKNGIILEASNNFCNKSGCTPEYIVGKNINIFKSNRTPRILYEKLWETITAGDIFTFEIENNNFKKGTNWYHTTISPMYDDNNLHIGYIAFYENIDDKVMYKKSSETDLLTGLANRSKLDRELALEIERSRRYKEPLSMILVDIDYFKQVNDTHGHQIGDSVLQEFSQILSTNIRATDIVGRWGGEEFLIICSQTDSDGALALAENLRKIIENFSFTTVHHKTASFGVSTYHDDLSVNLLFANVDQALYRAKENGRNRVECI